MTKFPKTDSSKKIEKLHVEDEKFDLNDIALDLLPLEKHEIELIKKFNHLENQMAEITDSSTFYEIESKLEKMMPTEDLFDDEEFDDLMEDDFDIDDLEDEERLEKYSGFTDELSRDKIVPVEEIVDYINSSKKLPKSEQERFVTINGSFDLLHAGHLKILHEAKDQGDLLIVALNSDESIRRYKSPERPIIPLEQRMRMIAALECVDFVTSFDEDTPIEILSQIKPDVHINGSEYGKSCIEAEVVEKNGGTLHIVNLEPDLSTSSIIKKIKSLCD